jgi:hypothetical protein
MHPPERALATSLPRVAAAPCRPARIVLDEWCPSGTQKQVRDGHGVARRLATSPTGFAHPFGISSVIVVVTNRVRQALRRAHAGGGGRPPAAGGSGKPRMRRARTLLSASRLFGDLDDSGRTANQIGWHQGKP